MPVNTIFSINQIDSNKIQIIGLINGYAYKRSWPGETAGSYSFSIRFFDAKKRLIKISNSEKDCSVRSVKKLEDRILNIYDKEFNGMGD